MIGPGVAIALAEPENRLVVRQLEHEWEHALAAQQQLREDYERFTAARPAALTRAERESITAKAADIPALWRAESTTDADRKELIRAVLEKVTIAIVGESEQVACTLTWAGGHTTTGTAIRAVRTLEQLSYYPQLVARIGELAQQGHRARPIVRILAAEGFRPAKGSDTIGVRAIERLLEQLGFPPNRRRRAAAPPGEEPGPQEWWLDDLAAELGMPPITLHSWASKGWVQGRRLSVAPHRWVLHAGPVELAALRERRARPPGWYTHRYWQNAPDAPPPSD